MSCGVGCRHGSDPPLLWLWCRLVATAPIQPLAWEPLHAAGAAQEIAKRQKKKKFKKRRLKWYQVTFLTTMLYNWKSTARKKLQKHVKTKQHATKQRRRNQRGN